MMKRSLFLFISSCILMAIGIFYNLAPEKMLGSALYKVDVWTISFARTSGIFIACFGVLSFLVRNHQDTITLRAVLFVTALMMVLTAGFDIWFRTNVEPVKNGMSCVLRFVLSAGYIYYGWKISLR